MTESTNDTPNESNESNDASAQGDTVEVRHQPAYVEGRYLVWRGEQAGPTPPLLVATHGYGEDGASILRDVRKIPGIDRWLVVSIEALHAFYTKKGEVVRSWMTKVDRERAIEHNTTYVADVVEAVVDMETAAGPVVFAGFSQGVAMAWRGAAGRLRRGHRVDGLVVLAADVPPDVAADPPDHLPPVLLGRGTQDQWYDATKMHTDLETLERLDIDVTPCVFEGGHLWSDEFLAATAVFLERCLERAGSA